MTKTRADWDALLAEFHAPSAPKAPTGVPRHEPHDETLFGVRLSDGFRWMEKLENEAEVAAWLQGEGEHCAQYLESIPGHAKLRERVRELGMAQAFVTHVKPANGRLFCLRTDKGGELRKLTVRDPGGAERVLVDPTPMRAAGGAHVSLDQFQPSDDGRFVAYGLAEGGGEVTSVHVLDTATGQVLPDVLPRIWGEFPVAWRADGSGFYYTQMAENAETQPDPLQGMRVLFHRLGAPTSEDVAVLGPGAVGSPTFESQEFPELNTVAGSRWVMGMATGARREGRLFAARADALPAKEGESPWTVIAEYDDFIEDWGVHGDDLYLLTSKNAPNRRVLRVSLERPVLAEASVVVAEGEGIIEEIAVDARWLYVHRSYGGHSRLERVPLAGGELEDVALPFEGWVNGLIADAGREGVVVSIEGWTHEGSYLALDPASKTFQALPIAEPSGVDFGDIVAERVEAKSADGTLVPLTILRHKDLPRDGLNPTILFGYGFYGAAMTPEFRPFMLAWLELGGIYATAHVRGGGEKGDAWRQAGKGPKKPNSIQDFVACAEHLIRERYTSAARLSTFSGSAGGIVVGRAITERPELFAAAAISNGIVNALRYLESSNGANQISELGAIDDEAGVRSLLAMDAFHNVRPGVKYPSILLTMGLNDARVSPWMTAKFGAQLRRATEGQCSMRIRFEGDEGHGYGSLRRQRFDHYADIWAFFLQCMNDGAA